VVFKSLKINPILWTTLSHIGYTNSAKEKLGAATKDNREIYMTLRTVQNRFAKYHSGDFNLKTKSSCRRLSEHDKDDLRPLVASNARISMEEVANKLNVNKQLQFVI